MAHTYGKPHEHIPSQDPVIPRERAKLAQSILDAQMVGEPHPVTKKPVTREQAAAALDMVKLYQTQDRYGPQRVKELAAKPNASHAVRQLDALTEDDMNHLTATFLGDQTP